MNRFFYLNRTLCWLNGRANLFTGLVEGNRLIDFTLDFGKTSSICFFNDSSFLNPLNTKLLTIQNPKNQSLNNFPFIPNTTAGGLQ